MTTPLASILMSHFNSQLSSVAFLFSFSDIQKRSEVAKIYANFTLGQGGFSRAVDVPIGLVFSKIAAGWFLNVAPSNLKIRRYMGGGYYLLSHKLEISVSYDKGNVFVGITRCDCIGVDIETVRPVIGKQRLLQKYFSPEELDELDINIEAISDDQFFWLWTRKEAMMKAKGTGLGGRVILSPEYKNTSSQVKTWFKRWEKTYASIYIDGNAQNIQFYSLDNVNGLYAKRLN